MSAYLWSKTLHIVFMTAWMATVFYLPRILVNLAEAADAPAPVRERLFLMGRRLYRFGHNMFGLAFGFGLLLWLGPRWIEALPPVVAAGSGWLHAKLTLVVLLLAHFIWTGRWLKAAERGSRRLRSPTFLRWFNELPLLLFVPLVYLVLAKPF